MSYYNTGLAGRPHKLRILFSNPGSGDCSGTLKGSKDYTCLDVYMEGEGSREREFNFGVKKLHMPKIWMRLVIIEIALRCLGTGG